MIRPITCVTFLLAAGSGLYLYQTKHKVHVLDAQIEQVVHQTEQVREQTRVLHAEWTLLDQPDRLQQLASQFLALQPTQPSQFTTAADLDSRLPQPMAPLPTPPPTVEEPPLVANAAPPDAAVPPATPGQPSRRGPTAVATLATPQSASARVVDHPALHPPEHLVEPNRETLATIRTPPYAAPVPHVAPPRLIATTLPRPLPVYRPAYQPPFSRPPTAVAAAAAPAYGGSMLGIARNAAPPPPAPAPVWVNWNR